MLAAAASLVVVIHHALADAGLTRRHAGADGGDDAAGLMPGDHHAPLDAPGHLAGREGGAVGVQIAAAHARRLDLEDDLARAWRGVGELPELQLAVAEKH